MKELQERIEECLVRLKELPVLIRAEREKMNGKAAIEELKERQKVTELEYRREAETMPDDKTGKKKYSNDKARDYYVITACQEDPDYQQVADEIKRFEHQRSTATMNHEALGKEHSGLISTVDVLREMLVVKQWERSSYQIQEFNCDTLSAQIGVAEAEIKRLESQRTFLRHGERSQEASNEEG